MIKNETSDLEAVLDIDDDLNAELFDDLLDTVLNEIKAKQGTNTKDSDDQIMPTASPNIYETDLMDDLDTPFHHDDDDTPFVPSKMVALSHQDHGFSPDHYHDDWSFDYLDSSSRRNSFIDSQCNPNINKCNITVPSYSDTNRVGIAADYELSGESSHTTKSNFFSKERVSEHPDLHVPSQVYEYRCVRSDSSANMIEDSKSNKNYHCVRQCPDFQSLYVDQGEQQQLSNRTSQHHYRHQDNPRYQQQSQRAAMFQDEDSKDTSWEEFLSWRCKHPENWTEKEVLDWLFYSAEMSGVDTTNLHGEAFRITGRDLCRMNLEDFQRIEPQYGQYFYSLFRQLLNGLTFIHPNDMNSAEPHISIPEDRDVHRFVDNSFSPKSTSQGHHEPEEICYNHSTSSPASPDQSYSFQQTKRYTVEYGPSAYPSQSAVENPMFQGYDYHPGDQAPSYGQGYMYNCSSQPYNLSDRTSYRPFKADKTSVTSVTSKYAGVITPRRRPGRPRIKSLPTEEELRLRQEKKLRSQHLWEFIFDMLNNPVYNPQVLKWENQKEGVFRFVQSETIAGLWGNLKNNENMTYEKLSRAMRHYYKRGILERVEGRRLVYKFSMSTLQRMREKRQAAYESATKEIAAMSSSSVQCLESSCSTSMELNPNDMKTNNLFSHSDGKDLVYMQPSSDDVISASAGMQFTNGNFVHPMVSDSTAHFTNNECLSAITSQEVTDLSDIGFHQTEGKPMIAIHEMPNTFSSTRDGSVQNFDSKGQPVIQTLYV